MKALPLSLFVFATVFLLSFAFPEDAGNNDGPRSLVDSRAKERYLQRRRPPPNIPGPKLSAKEFNTPSRPGVYEPEKRTKKHVPYISEKSRKKFTRLMKSKRSGNAVPLRRTKNHDENLKDGDRHDPGRNEQGNQWRGTSSRDDLPY